MPHRQDSISLDNGYQPTDYTAPPVDYDDGPGDAEYVDGFTDRQTLRRHFEAQPSRIPAHAPRPQDHQPKKAKKAKRNRRATDPAEREALGIETETVEYDGEEYTIPADPMDWSLPVTQAFEDGKVLTAIRGLLGPDQYRTLLGKGYTNRRFSELFELLAKAGGFETAGN